jgi:hypothetical protein
MRISAATITPRERCSGGIAGSAPHRALVRDLCGADLHGTVRRRIERAATFRGALLLGATLVAISGFLGSALIYGLQHYAWT